MNGRAVKGLLWHSRISFSVSCLKTTVSFLFPRNLPAKALLSINVCRYLYSFKAPSLLKVNIPNRQLNIEHMYEFFQINKSFLDHLKQLSLIQIPFLASKTSNSTFLKVTFERDEIWRVLSPKIELSNKYVLFSKISINFTRIYNLKKILDMTMISLPI